MSVAVLFARRDSVYKEIPGCDVFDADRNAFNYRGNLPVIAHPPCRLFGRMHTFSTADESEKQCAYFSVEQIRRCGGVLEHPSSSKLWREMNLPPIGGVDTFGGFTLPVYQSDFGHAAPKRTWLYICGVRPRDIPAPLYNFGLPSARIENMSTRQREATPRPFAEWLVELAGLCVPSMCLLDSRHISA